MTSAAIIAQSPALQAALLRKAETLLQSTDELLKEAGRRLLVFMAGFLPDEGEALIAKWLCGNVTTDKGTNLDLLLFTNVAPGETIAAASLTEPSGTGYARITLTDASWSGAADTRSYAQQTFTGGAGGWTGSVQGYAIVSKGATPRIVTIEVDSNGPYTFAENDTYKITPNLTVA
jgi:hypothetical protein